MKLYVAIALGSLLAFNGCQASKPVTGAITEYDEQEMDAAIARARNEVDGFIAELASRTGSDHAVKARIEDGGEIEHFWLIDISFQNGEFTGTINNIPELVHNVRIGQKWTVKKAEISDWMFFRDGKMYGNYTLRPLLQAMPSSQAAKLRSILAEP